MALETKTNRRRQEIEKNKSRKKAVDFESGMGSGLKRRRKKMEMMKRLIRRKKPNGEAGSNPKRNHNNANRDAGNSQPAIPRERYSSDVSCAPKMFFKARLIRICPRAINNRMPKTIRH